MTGRLKYNIIVTPRVRYVIRDISNSVTWSFPEFIPFCASLFYYSSFKLFVARSAAR